MPFARRRTYGRRKVNPKRTITKAKYQPRTVNRNRNLIMANARVVAHLEKVTRQHITYCDWTSLYSLDMNTDANGVGPFAFAKLTNFNAWTSTLRGNPNVSTTNSTVVAYMKLQLRCDLLYTQEGAYLQCFLLTPTKSNPEFDPSTTPIQSMPRVYQTSGPYMTGRFNPEAVTIWKQWTQSLSATVMDGSVPVNGPYTPQTIFHRKYYKPLNWKITSPLDRNWKDIDFDDLPYNRQLWFVCQVVTGMPNATYVMQAQAYFCTKNTD